MNRLLIDVINITFLVVQILLFARILMSWFTMGRPNRLMDLLFTLTEPILAPVRNIIKRSPLGGPGMVIDFSPIIVLFLLRVLNSFLVGLL